MSSMHRITLPVEGSRNGKPVSVLVYRVKGGLAITRPDTDKGTPYQITHLASGYSTGLSGRSMPLAVYMLRLLLDCGTDWTGSSTAVCRDMRARTAIGCIGDEINRIKRAGWKRTTAKVELDALKAFTAEITAHFA